MKQKRSCAWLVVVAPLIGVACDSKSETTSGTGGAPASSGTTSHMGGSAAGSSSGGGSSSAGSSAQAGRDANGGTADGGSPARAGSSAGGSSEGGASTGGSGQAGSAMAGAAGDNGCGSLVDTSTPIEERQADGEPPAPQGGTVVDGDYELTARDVYLPGTNDSARHSATLRIAGDQYELVRDGNVRETGTFSVTMSIMLKLSVTCPSAPSRNLPYTATPTALTLTSVSEHRTEVFKKKK